MRNPSPVRCAISRRVRLLSLMAFTAAALLSPSSGFAQSGIITTVAGNTQRGYSGDGGPATSARLAEPYGMALDAAGNIYIADTVNQVIRKVTRATGIITTIAGNHVKGFGGDGGAATGAMLSDPLSVAVDAAGNVYISDQLNNRIRRVSNGIITTVAGTGTPGGAGDGGSATSAQLCHPFGITLDGSGNLFIADAGNHRIRRVSASGIISTVAGAGVAICGQAGSFGGDQGSATQARLNNPTGVTLDAAGNLYIGDLYNHRIRRVTNGIITTVAGTGTPGFNGDGLPATQAHLHDPYMAAVDSAGNLYIPDYFNYRIRKVTATTGLISTVAGIGLSGWDGDGGPATQSYISDPTGVAVDGSGGFYIVDQASERIRRVSGTGTPASPPAVTAHPSNQRVTAGGAVRFSAAASGSPAPSVQWQLSADNGANFANIPGATGASLSFTASAGENGRQYRAVFTNTAGSAPTRAAALVVRTPYAVPASAHDLDGDGRGELTVWRPSNGTWFSVLSSARYSTAFARSTQWGNQAAGDVPLTGDLDGDRMADLVLWRASTGTWFWLTSSSGFSYSAARSRQWGSKSAGDVPFLGDVDGDARMDLIVWRASTGTWYWLTSSSGYTLSGGKQWGANASGDIPKVGDIDGDGLVDLIVWRPSSGTWFWTTSSSGYTASGAAQWGNRSAGDVPMIADMDADGIGDLVVWRGSTGTWYWLTSSSGYNAAAAGSRQWGNKGAGDIPLLADLDADGRADLIVWRAPAGTWYWLPSSSGFNYASAGLQQWGAAGDIPIIR